MCGFVGIFGYGPEAPPVDRDEVLRIRDAMIRRGPDAAGYWSEDSGRVAFGHRRLSIIGIDESGNQPMVLENSGTCITFNGEIYNYRELRSALEQQGRVFKNATDTEVLLHAYEVYGENMLQRLRGMYAFAIWDPKRRGVFVARDPLGIKPLYYTDNGDTVRIASQVKALLAGDVETPIDPAGCVSFFLLGYVAEPFTIRRNIKSLYAGHSMWIDSRGIGKPKQFFSVRDIFVEAEHSSSRSSIPECVETITEAIAQSVGAHLVADVPIGLFLSAGLDSTIIGSLAVKNTDQKLRTLTLGFLEYKGSPQDEVPIAEEASRAFATLQTTTYIDRQQFLQERGRVLAAMDQPTIDGVNTYFVSKAAADAGLKVALSGLGGDELFRSYPSFSQIPTVVQALQYFRPFPSAGRAVRWVASKLMAQQVSPKYAGLLEFGTSVEDAYLLRRGLYMPWELLTVLDPDMVRAGWIRLRPRLSLEEAIAGCKSPVNGVAILEMTWYMRNQLLRDTDWASMAHSLEVRTPLVDVELLRAIAPILARREIPTKRVIAANTSVGQLHSVMNHAKTGFAVPVQDWLAGVKSDEPTNRGLRQWAKTVFNCHAGYSRTDAMAVERA